MKTSFIAFLLLLMKATQIQSLGYCCCYYERDYFRGFKYTTHQVIKYDESSSDRQKSYRMIDDCYYQLSGIPTFENIDRLKLEDYSDPNCDYECSELLKQMNERFDVKQSSLRLERVKELKARRSIVNEVLRSRVQGNSASMSLGRPICSLAEVRGSLTNCRFNRPTEDILGYSLKEMNKRGQQNRNSTTERFLTKERQGLRYLGEDLLDSNNENPGVTLPSLQTSRMSSRADNPKVRIQSKLKLSSFKETKCLSKARQSTRKNYQVTINTTGLKFFKQSIETNDSAHLNTPSDKRTTTFFRNDRMEKLERHIKRSNFHTPRKSKPRADVKIDRIELALKSNKQLRSILDDLLVEIDYLEKPNKRPIDYILNRFSIREDILMRLIGLFDEGLDLVLHDHRRDFHQYIDSWSKMKEGSFNKYSMSS